MKTIKMQKTDSSKKGIIFSIDSLWALIMTLFIISLVINSTLTDFPSQSMQLQRQGMDYLTTLEVLDTFSGDPINKETVDAVFDSTASSTCMRLELFAAQTSLSAADTTNPSDSILKVGCTPSSEDEITIWRTWSHGSRLRFARLHIWNRVID